MYFLYRIVFNIVLLFSPLIFLVRLLKKKETLTSYKQKICLFNKRRQKGKLIWFHGASVGEIKSVIPMIEKLELNSEFKQILITSNTISSSGIINNFKVKKNCSSIFSNRCKFTIE
jgi:3-deoxy-D-manno-octulosonic-acid transferase